MRRVNISKSSRGWDMHVDGQYFGSYATQQEACSQIEFRVPEPNPQVTIDCRSEFNRKEKITTMSAFIGLTGEAKIFQDLMTD